MNKEAAELLKALRRFLLTCENVHHEKHEYHREDEECPVVAWIRTLMEKCNEGI